MLSARSIRRYLPLALLVVIAALAWRAADIADIDDERTEPILYERSLATPVLSARRVPLTLQAPVADDALGPAIDTVVTGSTPNSCLIVTVDGRVIESRNGDRPLVPASNEKILTTFVALELLGPDHTFTTELRSTGSISDGILEGDLFLVGGGDPFLSTGDWWTQYESNDGQAHTRLEALADQVVGAGVTSVTGAIYGDESLFDAERFGPWATRLIDTRQSGPLSALAVNEGFVSWPDVFAGSFRPRVPTDNPPAHAAEVFSRLLADRGVSVVSGGAAVAPPESSLLATLTSPPLADIAAHVNSYSNNFGAEILLKHLGLVRSGAGTTSAGAAAMMAELTERGFPMAGVDLRDGSGLSEDTTLTCNLLTEVLISAGINSPLAQGLSIGGVRGSLVVRHLASAATGNVFAKTGTLNDVTALSGYVTSPAEPGTTLTFAYVVNGELAGQDERIRGLQEPFVDALATYPAGASIATLSPLAPTFNPIPEATSESDSGSDSTG